MELKNLYGRFFWNVIDMWRCAYKCDLKCVYVGHSCLWDSVNYNWDCGTMYLVWYWVWVFVVFKLLNRKWVCYSDRRNVIGKDCLWWDKWCSALNDLIYDLVYEVSAPNYLIYDLVYGFALCADLKYGFCNYYGLFRCSRTRKSIWEYFGHT